MYSTAQRAVKAWYALFNTFQYIVGLYTVSIRPVA